MKFVSRHPKTGCSDLYKDVQRCAKMCKGSSTVRWLPHFYPFLSFGGRGPSLCVELVTMNFDTWCLWAITDWLDLIGTGPVADQLYVIGGRDNNQAWWVGARLNSARLGSTDLVSVKDDNDANQIWHDHDMIWHDQLVQLKVLWLCCSHLRNTLLTSLDISWHLLTSLDISWHLLTSLDISWHLTSLDPQEPLDVVEMFDAWNGKPLGSLDDRHPSTSTNTSWTVVQRCAALNICWAEVDHMPWNVGKEGRPGGDKMRRTFDEHLRKSWTSDFTLQVTIIYNSSDTRGIIWIWCFGMLWVRFLPGSHLELSVSCQPWVTGCAAAPLPNGCLMVCGGGCNGFFLMCFFHPPPVDRHVKLWCCDGSAEVFQGLPRSSKIFQVLGVAGYDEQGIGVLDSCEVLTVDADGKSSDCSGYMWVLLQFAPILNFRSAKIWFLIQSSSGGARQAQATWICLWFIHSNQKATDHSAMCIWSFN